MSTPAIRPHPQGGLTIAMPLPGSATARIYCGHYTSRPVARLALARAVGRLEGLVALEKIRGGLRR